MKKVLALLLAASLVATSFAACSKDSGESKDPANSKESSSSKDDGKEEEVDRTLDMVVAYTELQADQNDVYSWKYLADITNTTLNIESKLNVGTSIQEYKQLMFNTDAMPEIMISCGVGTTDIVTYGMGEGQMVSLTPYIEDGTMPNLAALFEEYPEAKTVYYAPDGGVYATGSIKARQEFDGPYSGGSSDFEIKTEWLKETGLDSPKTLDDLLELLRAMKENHPESIPFGGAYKASSGFQIVLSALGVSYWNDRNSGPFLNAGLVGDEVTFIYGDQERYKPLLEFYNTMYSEGLMNENFFSDDLATVKAYGEEGLYGVFAGAPPVAICPSRFLEYWGNEPLTSEYNDTQIWSESQAYHTIGGAVVTSNCDNPSVAAELIDALYDKNISIRFAAGPWEEDENKYIDMLGWDMENQDGVGSVRIYGDIENGASNDTTDYGNKFTASTAYNLGYFPNNIQTMCEIDGIEYQSFGLDKDTEQGRQRMSTLENLAPYYVSGYPTTTYFDNDTNAKIADLKTVINAYVEGELAKFVTGQRPITDDELTSYFAELDKIGYQEYLAIYADYYAGL